MNDETVDFGLHSKHSLYMPLQANTQLSKEDIEQDLKKVFFSDLLFLSFV